MFAASCGCFVLLVTTTIFFRILSWHFHLINHGVIFAAMRRFVWRLGARTALRNSFGCDVFIFFYFFSFCCGSGKAWCGCPFRRFGSRISAARCRVGTIGAHRMLHVAQGTCNKDTGSLIQIFAWKTKADTFELFSINMRFSVWNINIQIAQGRGKEPVITAMNLELCFHVGMVRQLPGKMLPRFSVEFWHKISGHACGIGCRRFC